MTYHSTNHAHSTSPTAHALETLSLYGAKLGDDDIDTRPLPEPDQTQCAISAMVEATHMLLSDTQLEEDFEDLLWAITNIFHRKLAFIERLLDDNECEQKLLIREQDGTEVKSLELERRIKNGQMLVEQRQAYEDMRDASAEHFHIETGSVWLPKSGSRVSHRGLTSAVIESRHFISAQKSKKNEIHCPEGTRIAFAGGDFQDIDLIWNVLDRTKEKYPDMILLHGGSPKGAEHIASLWADNRGVTQVVYKPDWKAHNNAAPFKRNDKLLEAMPIGLIATPGTGITDNIVDKARKLGITVKRIAS